uniref:Ig-like domain-containing protein n=1 Tax=Pavo cristatus TaxID=9049 RepID=A0A8C9EWA3_PAVCR
ALKIMLPNSSFMLLKCRTVASTPLRYPMMFALLLSFHLSVALFAAFLLLNIFLKSPTHLVKKGEYAELTCKVTGTPEIKITWFKDDRELKESDKFRMSFTKSLAILHLTEVETEDSGEYICEARNDAGKDTCSTIVTVKGVCDIQPLNPMTVVVGEAVELQARVEGSQPISVQWLKDKEEIIRETVISTTSSHCAILFCVCVLIPCVCSLEPPYFHFHLSEPQKPPVFDQPLQPAATEEGDTLQLSCHVRGSEPIRIQWLKAGREIRASERCSFSFANGVALLELAAVTKSDSGEYVCKASNVAVVFMKRKYKRNLIHNVAIEVSCFKMLKLLCLLKL